MSHQILFVLLLLAILTTGYGEENAQKWQEKMFEAAAAGEWDRLQYAISKGADPRGRTVLHWAAGEGHRDDLQRFIDEGASLEVRDDMGWTPLALAAFAGETESVRILIDHEADVATQDREESTPLHLAVVSGYEDVAKVLLQSGAALEAKDSRGWTPLFPAVTNYRNPEIVDWLLRMGASTSVTDRKGHSPLSVARKHRAEAIEMAAKEEPTPEWIAERVKGYTQIVQILEFAKATPVRLCR